MASTLLLDILSDSQERAPLTGVFSNSLTSIWFVRDLVFLQIFDACGANEHMSWCRS